MQAEVARYIYIYILECCAAHITYMRNVQLCKPLNSLQNINKIILNKIIITPTIYMKIVITIFFCSKTSVPILFCERTNHLS